MPDSREIFCLMLVDNPKSRLYLQLEARCRRSTLSWYGGDGLHFC
jgi:hypothetical protein